MRAIRATLNRLKAGLREFHAQETADWIARFEHSTPRVF